MASTYSTNLAIELIGTGDQAGSWGNTTNTNLGTLIEQAISGYVTQAVSTGTDTTITIPNGATGVARNMYIELTGTGGTNTNLIVPSNKKLYFIFNNSTGAVTVKVSGQTGVSVPQGKKVVLTSNGTDIVNGLNYIADFGSNSATITQLTATSATITNLTLTSLVISNLSIASANITTLTGSTQTLSGNLTLSGGTANGVLYLNGSKVATSGSALTFDGTDFKMPNGGSMLLGASASGASLLLINGTAAAQRLVLGTSGTDAVINATRTSGTSPNLLFQLEGANSMALTSTGLGIGTTSPGSKLDVSSTTDGDTVRISFPSAATGTTGGGLQFRAWTNSAVLVEQSRIQSICTDGSASYAADMRFMTANAGSLSEKMRLNSAGNLGLGVTPSAWAAGIKVFEFNTKGGLAAAGSDVNLLYNTYYDGANKYRTSDFANNFQMASGQFRWYTAPSGTAGNTISFTQAMTLDASGNLVVGNTTANERLEIYKGISYNADPALYFRIGANDGAVNNNAPYTWRTGITGSASGYSYVFQTLARTESSWVERARITAAGNVGIGTSTPSAKLSVNGNAELLAGGTLFFQNSVNTGSGTIVCPGGGSLSLRSYGVEMIGLSENATLIFSTSSSERARITSGGDLLVGLTSSFGKLSISSNGAPASSGNMTTGLTVSNGTAGTAINIGTNDGGGYSYIQSAYVNNAGVGIPLAFFTAGTERARITAAGEFIGGKTTAGVDTNGWELGPSGVVGVSRQADIPMYVNRNGDDGILVSYRQDGNGEGSVSVSGNTVSYNAFAGSHWSQLQDGSKPDILRGTVMESINELCEWPDETNERLPKAKISDTAGSKKVYGVFMAWDNDWTATNDMYVTAVGAFICRVNGSVTVQEGDLLESNGDGTARVQADDIIRSSTIGKVTSTVKTHQYDDGSYCVPTVLYCG